MENLRRRILLVAGARPNFMKIAPLMRAFQSCPTGLFDLLLVHTGQHYDDAMSGVFFEQLEIPRPDVNLAVGAGSHAQQTGEVMIRFEPVVSEWIPDLVVVVGDVNSTIACALVATKLGTRVAHVEAGLRSNDRRMPEEVNRILTDAISDFLFVSEPAGVSNLLREGVDPGKVFLVGNVMIDSLRAFLPKARTSTVLTDLNLRAGSDTDGGARRFALLTLHRPSNVDDSATLERILEGVRQVGEDIPVVFPVHPRTLRNIQQLGGSSRFRTEPRVGETGVWLIPPAGYLEFLHLMDAATVVLTDSGGIQEETTALGVPCLTIRENTERPITVDEGTNVLVGSDPVNLLTAVKDILSGRSKRGRLPVLWDGHASERIVDVLAEKLLPRTAQALMPGGHQTLY